MHDGRRHRASARVVAEPALDQNDVMLFVLFANQLEIELPKIVTTPINSTATSAMSRPYSVTAIPSSDFTKLLAAVRMRFIGVSRSLGLLVVLTITVSGRRHEGEAPLQFVHDSRGASCLTGPRPWRWA